MFINNYLKKLTSENLTNITEHSNRELIVELLQEIISQQKWQNLKIINEPKRDKKGRGAPDFLLKRNGVVLGYIENKKLEADLDDRDITKQMEKYKGLSDNLLLTNYRQWRWIKKGVEQKELRVNLGSVEEVFTTDFIPNQIEVDSLKQLLVDFLNFNLDKPKIGTAKELSFELASRTHKLFDYSLLALQQEQQDRGIK